MKKYYPYIMPLLALLFVGFLAFRWYNLRTDRGEIGMGEGVEIENLSESEVDKMLKGVDDLKTLNLDGDAQYAGQVRYEIADGKVFFSVMADVPMIEDGEYQVWVRKIDSESASKAFAMVYGKAGYIGSAGLSDADLPIEIIITKQSIGDSEMGEVFLKGILNKN